MESFFSFLEKRVDDCSSLLCIGLDPHGSELKEPSAASALDFCLNLVKQTARYAAAFKPNAAFFEVFGAEGWTALQQVIEAINEESHRLGSRIPIILDAKRGDISSTAEAYAKSAFETLGVDCITLSPYLGKDSIEPFLQNQEKGIFLLCKTSNPGSSDLQDITLSDRDLLYEHVAKLAQTWNTKNNIGLVVGATHLEATKRVRAVAPDLWFLAPGVGAQGGELESALRAGLRKDGKGMLIPISRGISRAESPAKAAFETLGVDCITLSPYLGKDSIEPFLHTKEKGVFLLCKTSNPGSGDLQDITLSNGDLLYEHVAKLAQTWNTKNNIGIVVGATHLEATKRVREVAPDLWFLAPGVGAQGGELESALRAGLRKDGKGILIPISRGISRVENPAKAAAEIRDEIVNIRYKLSQT